MRLGQSWIAVRGDLDRALEAAGLFDTRQLDASLWAPISAAQFGEWALLRAEALDAFSQAQRLRLSEGADVVACEASTTVMYSAASGSLNGEQIWSVVHDPDAGVDHLDVEGSPPPNFVQIRDRLLSEQAAAGDEDVDYVFNVPQELAAGLVGLPLDEEAVPADVRFTVLEPRLNGTGAERQARSRAMNVQLAQRVSDEIFPQVRALDFSPMIEHPEFHEFYPGMVLNGFVRHRGDVWECLTVSYGIAREAPGTVFQFFVRRGLEDRRGHHGQAFAAPEREGLLSRLTKPKRPFAATLDQTLEKAAILLTAIDQYLQNGTPHPEVSPPSYLR